MCPTIASIFVAWTFGLLQVIAIVATWEVLRWLWRQLGNS